MGEIPKDIMQTARMCTTDGEIARALLAERQSATAAERERCAKIAETGYWSSALEGHVGKAVAAAIRGGSHG